MDYGYSEDYLDEDDDGIMYSTRNYCSDSEDEQLIGSCFVQKREKKHHGGKSLNKDSESEEEDDFEKDMSAELSCTMRKLTAPLLAGTSAESEEAKKEPQYYDDIYFDSDASDVEEAVEGSAQTSGSKHKRKILTNDELLYDPNMDDEDQAWVDKIRRSYQVKNLKRLHKSQKLPKVHPLPHSDAVLNCPACFTTLCLDCQRHEIYKEQYRAMFVFNCEVDPSEILHFSRKESKKKLKQAKRKKKKVKSEDDSSVNFRNSFDTGDAGPGVSDSCTDVTNSTVPKEEVEKPIDKHIQQVYTDFEHVAATQKHEGSSSLVGLDEDSFHPVRCRICNTKVAVYDKDEVYHFFNILTSY